jgi:PPM family protein phosphatase
MGLTSQGLTDPGCVRPENQDRILFDDALGLYVVCDGMGGRRRGDFAAELATDSIRQYVESSRDPKEVTWPYGYNLQMSFAANRLLTAAKLANRQVWRRSEEAIEYLGMGTTITAVLFDNGSAAIVNIGDSRVYLWRAATLEQLSVDDTVGGPGPTGAFSMEMVRQPMLRSVLTRAAGSQENADVHLKECKLEAGDVLLLSSDGLHGIVPDDRIGSILAAAESVNAAAAALIAAARDAGAPDNVSAVVVEYRDQANSA